MEILVTVGTTKFDPLIEKVASIVDDECFQNVTFYCQIADGKQFINKRMNCFSYIENINSYYDKCDLIITHAGAGSIYSLLDKHKKMIIVPNLFRIDKHQSDIALYMEKNHCALVCWDLNDLKNIILNSNEFRPTNFIAKRFFKYDFLIEEINIA